MLEAYLLAHETEHGLICEFIFQTQRQWRAFAFREIIDVIFFTNLPSTQKIFCCVALERSIFAFTA